MLSRLKAIFSSSEVRQIPNGLGVPELPSNFVKGSETLSNNHLKNTINQFFLPKIKELGYQGKDFYFYKENTQHTQAVFFWLHRGGGAVQVDLLVKFNSIIYPSGSELAKDKPLRPANSEFQFRLSPNNKEKEFVPDNWFWLLTTTEQGLEMLVNDIWRVFEARGIPYFKQFENHQKLLSEINPKNFTQFPDFRIQNFILRNQLEILYFLHCYWKISGNSIKANEFASALKSLLKEEPNEEFQALINGK